MPPFESSPLNALFKIKRADLFAQRQDVCGGHTEFVHTDFQEKFGQIEVSCQFAANSDPLPFFVGVGDRHFDQAQKGGMMSVKQGLELCVLTIDRQRVLRQIVGSDAEERRFFG